MIKFVRFISCYIHPVIYRPVHPFRPSTGPSTAPLGGAGVGVPGGSRTRVGHGWGAGRGSCPDGRPPRFVLHCRVVMCSSPLPLPNADSPPSPGLFGLSALRSSIHALGTAQNRKWTDRGSLKSQIWGSLGWVSWEHWA